MVREKEKNSLYIYIFLSASSFKHSLVNASVNPSISHSILCVCLGVVVFGIHYHSKAPLNQVTISSSISISY